MSTTDRKRQETVHKTCGVPDRRAPWGRGNGTVTGMSPFLLEARYSCRKEKQARTDTSTKRQTAQRATTQLQKKRTLRKTDQQASAPKNFYTFEPPFVHERFSGRRSLETTSDLRALVSWPGLQYFPDRARLAVLRQATSRAQKNLWRNGPQTKRQAVLCHISQHHPGPHASWRTAPFKMGTFAIHKSRAGHLLGHGRWR